MTPLGLLFTSTRVLAAVYKLILTMIMIYILIKDFDADERIKRAKAKYQRSRTDSGGPKPS